MQALFYMDASRYNPEVKLALFLKSRKPSEKIMPFFWELVNGVELNRNRIDEIVERFSSNWKINRMSGVDRNAIRIAVYEMAACQDIPVKVSINEAIDIGKKFGTEESGAFVNGILDSIHLALEKQEIQLDFQIPEPYSGVDPELETGNANEPPPEKLPSFTRVRGKFNVVKRRLPE